LRPSPEMNSWPGTTGLTRSRVMSKITRPCSSVTKTLPGLAPRAIVFGGPTKFLTPDHDSWRGRPRLAFSATRLPQAARAGRSPMTRTLRPCNLQPHAAITHASCRRRLAPLTFRATHPCRR
jgi:hypothetical protein